MIPLNKPGYLRPQVDENYLSTYFPSYNSVMLATAGDGLNFVYRTLKEQCGKLRVGVSPLACFQAIYPIIVNGHVPVFVDIDKETFNLDTEKLVIRKDLDVVELIHLGGNPNEMDKICSWAKQNNKIVIEDCAQALGSTFQGRKLGSFGDYSVYSLIKNLHAPTGGLLLSKTMLPTEQLQEVSVMLVKYRKLKKYLESHSNHHVYNLWNLAYWLLLKMKEKGAPTLSPNSYRVGNTLDNELRHALNNIEELNRRRIANAFYMMTRVDVSKCRIQTVPKGGMSNRNRLLLHLEKPMAEQVIFQLRKSGIAANNLTQNYLHGFQPHVSEDALLCPYYHKDELKCYDSVYNHIVAIPCSPFLTQCEMDYIVNELNKNL